MIYAVLVLIVVIAFLLGVTFVYKGISEKPQVALEEFEKVKADLAASRQNENKLKADLESAVKEISLAKKTLEDANSSLQRSQEDLAAVQDSEKSYKSKVRELEDKLTALYTKADDQAKNALELISALRQENETLKQKTEAPPPPPQPAPDTAAVEALTKESETLKAQSQELSVKVQQLEQELAAQKSESEKQLAEARAQAASVQQAAPVAVPVADDIGKADFEIVRTENEQLKAQLAESLTKIAEFENTVAQLKNQPTPAAPAGPSEAELAERAELKKANEDLSGQLEQMKKALEQIRTENAALAAQPKAAAAASPESEAQIAKLKELNEFLTKKEKMLQTELTKSRVKALGLERICADFKTQLEVMSQRAVKA